MDEASFVAQLTKLLQGTPEALKHFLKVLEILAFKQPDSPDMPSRPTQGPQPAVEGATYTLLTQSLSQDDIDKLTEGQADAVVIEKLQALVTGFVKGVIFAAGVA